jgi:hypothetical protein
MFYRNDFDKVYIVNGLARSGNHLFLSWLISGFNKGEVYYLNNVKPRYYGLIGGKEKLHLDKIIKYHTVCSDNKYGKKLDDNIRLNLVKQKEMNDFLMGKPDQKIKVLILSMENKKVKRIEEVANKFTNATKIYKCIVIRDILNLFSSRIESELLLSRKSDYYETDKVTIDYWMDNYDHINNQKYITYNYNNFLCYLEFRKKLAKKLDINFKKTKITYNKYGLTQGSSFKENAKGPKTIFFLRWLKNKDHKLIKFLLNDEKILGILCQDFSMCLNLDKKVALLCRKIKKELSI